MNILINNKKERWEDVVFDSNYSIAINYDLLFLNVSIVAPKMMATSKTNMPVMVALNEDSPKHRVPLTVRSERQNEKHSTRDLSWTISPGNNPDVFFNRIYMTYDCILVLHCLF